MLAVRSTACCLWRRLVRELTYINTYTDQRARSRAVVWVQLSGCIAILQGIIAAGMRKLPRRAGAMGARARPSGGEGGPTQVSGVAEPWAPSLSHRSRLFGLER